MKKNREIDRVWGMSYLASMAKKASKKAGYEILWDDEFISYLEDCEIRSYLKARDMACINGLKKCTN